MGDHHQLEYAFKTCHHFDATYHAYMAGLILFDPASYIIRYSFLLMSGLVGPTEKVLFCLDRDWGEYAPCIPKSNETQTRSQFCRFFRYVVKVLRVLPQDPFAKSVCM